MTDTTNVQSGRLRFAAERIGLRAGSLVDTMATIIMAGIILLAMQLGSTVAPDYVMPPVATIFASFVELLANDYLSIGITFVRLFLAVIFAMLVGSLLGMIMGTSPRLRPFVRALVVIDSGVPALSWMLLAIFWFKNPEARIFFILAVILIPFYALNVYDGIRSISTEWIEMFNSFRPSRLQSLAMFIIPQMIPYILMTTKSVIGYATRMVIFAELIGATIGIGASMGFAQATFRIDSVLAWTVFLVLMNIFLQFTVTMLEKWLLSWRPEGEIR